MRPVNILRVSSPKPSVIGNVDSGGKMLVGNATQKEVDTYQEMVSDDILALINLYVNILLCGTMAIFGTLTNTISMIIFYRLGLKDSNSVCLLTLAFTDCLLCLSITLTRAFLVWGMFFPPEGIDPISILFSFSWISDSLFLCSGWIVTFLSLERCVCVLFPFQVKDIFTRNRAIIVLLIIHTVTASIYAPMYATHWLEWISVKIESTNGTDVEQWRLVILFTDNRPEVEYYVEMLSVTIIPVPSLVLTFGSVVLMIYGLNASSRIRSSMTVKTTEIDGTLQDSKMTIKTRRLMKMVLFIAIICIVCSIPRFFATTINTINPEISEAGKEKNMHIVVWQLSRFATALNASVNIFVYLKINSYYQSTFQQLFHLKCKA